MAVGVWTLIEKTDYISLLPSMTYAASAYILVLAGVIVMVTGVLGCCATFKEHRRLLRVVRDHVMLERDNGGREEGFTVPVDIFRGGGATQMIHKFDFSSTFWLGLKATGVCHLFCTVCAEQKSTQCPKHTLSSFLTLILTCKHNTTHTHSPL